MAARVPEKIGVTSHVVLSLLKILDFYSHYHRLIHDPLKVLKNKDQVRFYERPRKFSTIPAAYSVSKLTCRNTLPLETFLRELISRLRTSS